MRQLPSAARRSGKVDGTPLGRRQALLAALGLAAVTIAGPALAFTSDELVILSGKARHRFSIELARTPAERAQGLMFRDTMDPDHGMLFDFGVTQHVAMWMKNTKLPLDMLFMDGRGRIIAIAARTTPYSEAVIDPGQPARAVLELNAGTTARLGIEPGGRVLHPMFDAPK